MSLTSIDWLIVAGYFGYLIWAAVHANRSDRAGVESYLTAGRRLTLPAFVATTVASWYGGILGVGEYAWRYGVSNWLVFGAPYYLGAAIFAFFIAGRAHRSRLLSIPDQLRLAYGGKVAFGGSLVVFAMTIPGAYVLMMGVLLKMFLGWPLAVCLAIAVLSSLIYVLTGGFRSVVRTDVMYIAVMYTAFIVMVVALLLRFGGMDFLRAHLPPSHFTWHGGRSAGYVVSWYFIAMSALVEPLFFEACYAAKTRQIARNGLLISILFWMLFDFLTTTTGLYSRAVLGGDINGVEAFPRLADQVLPPGLKGLFLIGLAATIQSTIDSYSLISATLVGHDILARIKALQGKISEVALIRWGLAFTGAGAFAIALGQQSVVNIWYRFGSLGTPALLLPLALSYSEKLRFRPDWALANILATATLVGWWFIMQGEGAAATFPFSIPPIYIGLAVSLLLWTADHLTRNRG
jgi:SSS family solute:Na+ symporter